MKSSIAFTSVALLVAMIGLAVLISLPAAEAQWGLGIGYGGWAPRYYGYGGYGGYGGYYGDWPRRYPGWRAGYGWGPGGYIRYGYGGLAPGFFR